MNNREYFKSIKTEVLIFKISVFITLLSGLIYLYSVDPFKRYIFVAFGIFLGIVLTFGLFILSWRIIGNYLHGGLSPKYYAALELSLILNPDNEVLKDELDLDQENVKIIHKLVNNPGSEYSDSIYMGKDPEGKLYKSERSMFYDPDFGIKSGYTSWKLISPELYDYYIKNYTETSVNIVF